MTTNAFADTAADSVNTFGVDLYKKLEEPKSNLCISPYSIQAALSMAYAGAAGDTRAEMARVLHYGDNGAVHESFAGLSAALEGSAAKTIKMNEDIKKHGGEPGDPVTLRVANRLFGAKEYEFRNAFIELMKKSYGAPLEAIDVSEPVKTSARINGWVEEQTANKIRDLVPPDAIQETTRLILVNALYFKAPWMEEFSKSSTAPRPFHLDSVKADVPTMFRRDFLGYAKRDGYEAVALTYAGGEFQFLILLPDKAGGTESLEKKLDAKLFAENTALNASDLELYLPKFKIEPPAAHLGKILTELGLTSTFDIPPGSANFDGIAAKTPEEYLFLSEVIHKTFIAVDEKGTEAAAATALLMLAGSAAMPDPPKPIEVRVDRPFLFAVQHVPTKTLLFLGKVADPR